MGRYSKPDHDFNGDRFDWGLHKGALLMFTVHDYLDGERKIQTKFRNKEIENDDGKREAVKVDVMVLDGGDAGHEYLGVLVFPMVLVSSLRRKVGEVVLGRLDKSGRSWVLEDPTENDEAIADAFLDGEGESPADDDDTPDFLK